MTPFAHRRFAVITALTLSAALLPAAPTLAAPAMAPPAAAPPAGTRQASPPDSPGALAAGYLARQLEAGKGVFSVTSDGTSYPDYGVTADAVLALDAAGVAADQADRSTSLLAEHAVDYIGFGNRKAVAAGSVAKLLSVALAQGRDPSDFGGYNLVTTLESRESDQGRFTDKGAKDYSNTFVQALAIIGLSRAGVAPSAPAVHFLKQQQCSDGGFRLDPDAKGCSSDPDATAVAVQALLSVDGAPDRVGTAALDYLAGRQQGDGGVKGSGKSQAVNANTTGLAGQAFAAGARGEQAAAATRYLTGLQYGCDQPAALRGGIAYDAAALTKQEQAGAAASPSDEDRRSTSQAVLALARAPLLSITADGAATEVPVMSCDAAATSSGAASTSGAAASADSVSASSGPSLAGIAVPVGLALLLLIAGTAYLVVARRKGGRT